MEPVVTMRGMVRNALMKDLVSRLNGDSGDRWLKALRWFINTPNPWEMYEVPKSIEIGTYKNTKLLRKALEKAKMYVDDPFGGFNEIPLRKSKYTLKLAVRSPKDLGFTKDTELGPFYEKAQGLGFHRCPLEAGPQLRLQYPNQPVLDWLMIATEPFKDNNGSLNLFLLDNDRTDVGLEVAVYFISADRCWDPDDRFVFVSGK